MAYEFRLPDIGEGLSEAEVVRWLVAVGDRVSEDQPLVEIQTDKALVEMPAPATGVVARLGAGEGAIVKVGEVLLVIDDGKAPAVAEPAETAAAVIPPTAAAPAPGAAPPRRDGRPLATPATRRLARELGVDLAGLAGSGPGGRITDDDVRAAAAPAPQPAETAAQAPEGSGEPQGGAPVGRAPVEGDQRLPLRRLRRRTAETTAAAWREIPHITGFHEVDAGELLALHQRLRPRAEAAGTPLTLTAFLVKAAALALVEHPMVNSSMDAAAGEIVLRRHRNVGVAVATTDGLVVPVVRDADTRPLLGIARELERLAVAARGGRVDLADLQGGTFTVTNHGPLGGWFGTPIIKPPEAGILGFGRAQERAVVVDGQLAVGQVLPMSFAADHRIIDGDLSIAFCLTVKGLLQDPLQLLLGEG
jgi:pyruvate/2-oxoglutarate dehydrogenase complex dihydrolipoamide acyltransferase (E2) component